MAEEPHIPAEVLDQSEIDRLLAQADGTAQQAQHLFIRADGNRGDGATQAKVEAYDFRNPVFLSEVELRRLRLLHEDFIRYLGARLALKKGSGFVRVVLVVVVTALVVKLGFDQFG